MHRQQQEVMNDQEAALWLAQNAYPPAGPLASSQPHNSPLGSPSGVPSHLTTAASCAGGSPHPGNNDRYSPGPGAFFSPVFAPLDTALQYQGQGQAPAHSGSQAQSGLRPSGADPPADALDWSGGDCASQHGHGAAFDAPEGSARGRMKTRAQHRRLRGGPDFRHDTPGDAPMDNIPPYSHFYNAGRQNQIPSLDLNQAGSHFSPDGDIPVAPVFQQQHQAPRGGLTNSASSASLNSSFGGLAPNSALAGTSSQGSGSPASAPRSPPYSGRQQPKTSRRQSKLTNLDRRKICEYANDHRSATQEDIGQQWGIDRSSVSKILKYKEKWLTISPHTRAAKVVKHRGGRYPQLEAEVVRRLKLKLTSNVFLGDKVIKEAALEVSAELNLTEAQFKASNGWLDAFKERAQIKGGKFLPGAELGELGVLAETADDDGEESIASGSAASGGATSPLAGPSSVGGGPGPSSLASRSHLSGTPLSSPHGSERSFPAGLATIPSGLGLSSSVRSASSSTLGDLHTAPEEDNTSVESKSASTSGIGRVTRRTSRLSMTVGGSNTGGGSVSGPGNASGSGLGPGLVVGPDGRAYTVQPPQPPPHQPGDQSTPPHSRSSSASVGSQSRRSSLGHAGPPALQPETSIMAAPQSPFGHQAQPSSRSRMPHLRHAGSASSFGASAGGGTAAAPENTRSPRSGIPLSGQAIAPIPHPGSRHEAHAPPSAPPTQAHQHTGLHYGASSSSLHHRSASAASSPSEPGIPASSSLVSRSANLEQREWVHARHTTAPPQMTRRNTVSGAFRTSSEGGVSGSAAGPAGGVASSSSAGRRVTFDAAYGALDTVMKFLQEQPTIEASPKDYMVLGELFGRMKEKKQELDAEASGSSLRRRLSRGGGGTQSGSGLGLVIEDEDDYADFVDDEDAMDVDMDAEHDSRHQRAVNHSHYQQRQSIRHYAAGVPQQQPSLHGRHGRRH